MPTPRWMMSLFVMAAVFVGGLARADLDQYVALGALDPYVVIDPNAKLYIRPDLKAPHFVQETDLQYVGFAYRFVAQRDEWLEIETLGETTSNMHCASDFDAFTRARIRLFVRVSERLPLTARRLELRGKDGTFIQLEPGVPIAPSGRYGPKPTAVADGLLPDLEVPNDAVAETSPLRNVKPPDRSADKPSPAERYLREAHLEARVYAAGHSFRWIDRERPFALLDIRRTNRNVLGTIERRCIKARVRAPVSVMTEESGEILCGTLAPVAYIRKDATLFLTDGARLGVTTSRLPAYREREQQAGRRCFFQFYLWFPLVMGAGEPQPAVVCVDPADVTDRQPR